MIKYRTRGFGNKLIEPVEVLSETECFVEIKSSFGGTRRTKKDGYHTYHDSFDDAKQHLIKRARVKLKSELDAAERTRETIKRIEALTND